MTKHARLIEIAEKQARTEFGPAFALLGERLQRAIVAQAFLAIVAGQDEAVPAETIRELVVEGHLHVALAER